MAAAPTAHRTGFDPRWLPPGVTTIGSFMSILDSSIVNIALPSVLRDFHSNLEAGQLVITSYLMALAVVIPLTGFLAERVGMKRLYIITLVLFTAGSALCGFAWDMPSLIGFRVVQGLGGGMLQPLGMALVFTLITPLERPYFMGLLGIPMLLGPILGPTVGGYITEYSHWRAIFLINIPIGGVGILAAFWLLKETAIRHDARLDLRGFVLSAFAFPSLVLGLSLASDQGWTQPVPLALIGVSLVALVAFVRVELGQRDPMLQLRLFLDPMFRLAVGIQWIGFFSLFGLNFVLSLFLQLAHHWGAAETGLALLPMGVMSFITMNLAGRLYNRVGPRPLAASGLLVLSVTSLLWSFVDADTGIVTVLLLAGGRGIALGLFSQTVQMVAYNTVQDGQMPRATALVNVTQRINGGLSAAVLTTILSLSLALQGAAAHTSVTTAGLPLPEMIRAFQDAFYFMAGLSVVGFVLSLFLRDRVLEAHHATVHLEATRAHGGGEPIEALEG